MLTLWFSGFLYVLVQPASVNCLQGMQCGSDGALGNEGPLKRRSHQQVNKCNGFDSFQKAHKGTGAGDATFQRPSSTVSATFIHDNFVHLCPKPKIIPPPRRDQKSYWHQSKRDGQSRQSCFLSDTKLRRGKTREAIAIDKSLLKEAP